MSYRINSNTFEDTELAFMEPAAGNILLDFFWPFLPFRAKWSVENEGERKTKGLRKASVDREQGRAQRWIA